MQNSLLIDFFLILMFLLYYHYIITSNFFYIFKFSFLHQEFNDFYFLPITLPIFTQVIITRHYLIILTHFFVLKITIEYFN